MKDKEFLRFLYERLANVHKENPNVDYMSKLRCIIKDYPDDKYTPNVFKQDVVKELKDFPIIHILSDEAYEHCNQCGAEYIGVDVGRIPYSRTTASGDYGTCLFCKEEMSIDLESGGYL